MTDISDLVRHVEANPTDHQKRWHLAKKLYMKGDYRSALGHLLVLRTNWTPKVNVLRYLAATLYRLERYPEAVDELKAGIEEWPEEFTLREQLARFLEVMERTDEAQQVWRELLERDPQNQMAQQALNRPPEAKKPEEAPAPKPLAFAFEAGQGRTCPNCGALNTDEFDRCWKCHAMLSDTNGTPEPMRIGEFGRESFGEDVSAASGAQWIRQILTVWYAAAGVAAVALLAVGAYYTWQRFMAAQFEGASASTVTSVKALFINATLSTRMVVGGILLIAWPTAFWVAWLLVRAPTASLRISTVTGLLCATLTYLVAWGLPTDFPYVLAVMAGVPLVLSVLTLRVGLVRGLAIWAVQSILVAGIASASLIGFEGSLWLKELPRIARYAREHDLAEEGRYFSLPTLSIPVNTTIRWDSTGSQWLDALGSKVLFELSTPTPSPGLSVELSESDSSKYYNHLTETTLAFTCTVDPFKTYVFLLDGPEKTKVDVTISALLRTHVGN